MTDAKGRALKIGDCVMVPCIVVGMVPEPDFCNLAVRPIATMPPRHLEPSQIMLNMNQVLRAHDGDVLSFEIIEEGKIKTIR